MSGNRTPLGGRPLQQPDPPLPRVNAVHDADQPCLEHQVAYTGRVPCTGVLRCSLCLCTWDPDTGAFLDSWPPRRRLPPHQARPEGGEPCATPGRDSLTRPPSHTD